jgi:hypothetical protein
VKASGIRSTLSWVLCLAVCDSAMSTPISTTPSNVTVMSVNTDFGGGDVVFRISGSSGSCYGFWLRASDPGFKAAYASLIAVYAGERLVGVYAFDDELWTGSTNPYCRVSALFPE